LRCATTVESDLVSYRHAHLSRLSIELSVAVGDVTLAQVIEGYNAAAGWRESARARHLLTETDPGPHDCSGTVARHHSERLRSSSVSCRLHGLSPGARVV